jgi:hypothetical protein
MSNLFNRLLGLHQRKYARNLGIRSSLMADLPARVFEFDPNAITILSPFK